jgi:hypothetical protein
MEEEKEKEKAQRADEKEKCVVCRADTGYLFGTPIDERQFYIIGVGQLCSKCYCELYTTKKG